MVADTLSDNRQFFCHFNWLLLHWPSTFPLDTDRGGAPTTSGGTHLRHRPTHPLKSNKNGGNSSVTADGGGATYAADGGTVSSGGTCRTQLISLDDETYFSNTTRYNDVNGDGFKDGESIGDEREDVKNGDKVYTGRWGGIDVEQGVSESTVCIVAHITLQ